MSALARIAIVVGVGPGLGAGAARRFAQEGYNIALVSRRIDSLKAIEESITASGGKAVSVVCDTGKPADVRAAFATIKQEFGGSPEVLIYNAGPSNISWPPKGVLDTPVEDFAASFDAGVVGAYAWAQQVLPAMIEAGHGTILLTGATASLRGSAKFALLAAPKFALRAVSQCLAREFQPKGIHVAHIIIDGQIESPRLRSSQPDRDPLSVLKPDAIADTYWHLHSQDKTAWTLELELRPLLEKF